MRAVVLATVLVPTLAAAEAPLPTVVYQNRIKPAVTQPGIAALSVSRKVYINDCRPNGCTVTPGNDDSRTNRSSIPQQPVVLDAWPHGDGRWDELMACVKETFLPFNIEVVTTDPGTANHFEVMVGGSSAQLDPELVAGGVAPFVGCGASDDNVISFVFANGSADINYLCGAVAQEAAHVWGLDHELNKLDPMTYLDLGSKKRFQNTDSPCGEELSDPRPCWCGGASQNSYAYLADLFGAATLPPATLDLGTPTEGQWVRPGFPVRAALTSVLGETSASFSLDGVEIASLSPGPFAFNAPATLAGGNHVVRVDAVDGGGRTATATVNVQVTAACTAGSQCPDNAHCIGGYCIPGASVAGGLGAECTGNSACITNQCGQADGQQLCTAACDAGNACPDGFACLAAGENSVCWPTAGGGGCAASGDTVAPAWLLAGVGALVLRRRRRTR
ncbi:MAG: MYXO-CTERM sorting domain-containing protein [Kofleriaceae bacterium]|nr:MYXO-CTERM sorting domain-containing protein [Kofleriaceae bacterium]